MAFGFGQSLNLGSMVVTLGLQGKEKFSRDMTQAQGSLGTLATGIKNNSRSLFALGAAATAAGGAIVGGLGVATKAAISNESAMAMVRKTTGLSAEDTIKLKDELFAMSTTMERAGAISYKELFGISEVAGQLGLKGVANIAGFTESIAKIAATTEFTGSEAAETLGQIAAQSQIASEGMSEFALRLGSTWNELANNTNASERAIANFQLRIEGAGRAVGMTTPELAGIATTFVNLGVRAEMGGTQVSKLINRLQMIRVKGGEDLAKFAEIAGVSTEQFAKLIREKPTEALTSLINGISKATDRTAVMMDLFGSKKTGEVPARLADALNRVTNAGDLMSERIGMAVPAWQEMTSIQEEYMVITETAAAMITMLKNNFGELFDVIGTKLLPALKPLISHLTSIVGWAADFAQAHPNITTGLIAVAGAIGGVMLVLGPLLVSAASLVTIFGTGAVAALGAFAVALAPIAVGLALATSAAISWYKAGVKVERGLDTLRNKWMAAINEQEAQAEQADQIRRAQSAGFETFTQQQIDQIDRRIEALKREREESIEQIEGLTGEALAAKQAEIEKIESMLEASINRRLTLERNAIAEEMGITEEGKAETARIEAKYGARRLELEKELAVERFAVIEGAAQKEAIITTNGLVEQLNEKRVAKVAELNDLRSHHTQILNDLERWEWSKEDLTRTQAQKLFGLKKDASAQEFAALTMHRDRKLSALEAELRLTEQKIRSAENEKTAIIGESLAEQSGMLEESFRDEMNVLRMKESEILDEMRRWKSEKEKLTEAELKKILEIKKNLTHAEVEMYNASRTSQLADLQKSLSETRSTIDIAMAERIGVQKATEGSISAIAQEGGDEWVDIEKGTARALLAEASRKKETLIEVVNRLKSEQFNVLKTMVAEAADKRREILQEIGQIAEDAPGLLEPGWRTMHEDAVNWLGKMASVVATQIDAMRQKLAELKKALSEAVEASWYTDAMRAFAEQSRFGFGSMATASAVGTDGVIQSLGTLHEALKQTPVFPAIEVLHKVGDMPKIPPLEVAHKLGDMPELPSVEAPRIRDAIRAVPLPSIPRLPAPNMPQAPAPAPTAARDAQASAPAQAGPLDQSKTYNLHFHGGIDNPRKKAREIVGYIRDYEKMAMLRGE
jgi:TP901 family phage tail tape measure protein